MGNTTTGEDDAPRFYMPSLPGLEGERWVEEFYSRD